VARLLLMAICFAILGKSSTNLRLKSFGNARLQGSERDLMVTREPASQLIASGFRNRNSSSGLLGGGPHCHFSDLVVLQRFKRDELAPKCFPEGVSDEKELPSRLAAVVAVALFSFLVLSGAFCTVDQTE
jgi:hypothetical protein